MGYRGCVCEKEAEAMTEHKDWYRHQCRHHQGQMEACMGRASCCHIVTQPGLKADLDGDSGSETIVYHEAKLRHGKHYLMGSKGIGSLP